MRKTAIFLNEWQKFIFMSTNVKKNVVKQDKNDKNLFFVLKCNIPNANV